MRQVDLLVVGLDDTWSDLDVTEISPPGPSAADTAFASVWQRVAARLLVAPLAAIHAALPLMADCVSPLNSQQSRALQVTLAHRLGTQKSVISPTPSGKHRDRKSALAPKLFP